MKTVRTVLLLCGVTLAAIALGASTAAAGGAITVRGACSPCVFQVTGESHVNLFGVRVSTCADTLSLELYGDGTGHATYAASSHNSGGACTRQACNGVGEAASESEFDILAAEETALGVSTLTYRFCFDTVSNPNATGTHCTTSIATTKPSDTYHLALHGTCAAGLMELEAEWEVPNSDAIEIAHV